MISLPQEIDQSLTEFLENNSLIKPQQFEKAKLEINGSGQSIITHMLNENLLTEDDIANSFSKFYGLKKINISNSMLRSRPMQEEITDNFVKKNRIIPFRSDNETITVIISDPSALNNVNDVKRITGRSVETLVTTISAFEDYLQTLDESVKSEDPPLPKEEKKTQKKENNEVHIRERDLESIDDEKYNGSDVINFVDFIIEKAVSLGASDLHFEIFRDDTRLRIRRDGVLQELEDAREFLSNNYSAVTTRIKILADLDISERRLPQDGGIAHNMEDKTIDIRASVLPTAHGERIVMRILDPDAANFSLDKIGIPEKAIEKVRRAIHAPQGMVLVTGPTGSGKSTTLYSFLKELNHDGVNILTAEDPVEFDLDGVGQVQVKENIGLTFTSALRSFLRQDPEIIMVGEIRDKDTSDIAIKAALTGHLVLSTLHTNDAPSTITRMVNMGIPPYLITAALSLVVAQRLARVNCDSCKEEDESYNLETLLSLGFNEKEARNLKVYKGKGCDKCFNTGIKGRRGIYEVLPVTDKIKEAVMMGKTDITIKDLAQKEGFVTMQETARDLIKEGLISVEEYQRILMLE